RNDRQCQEKQERERHGGLDDLVLYRSAIVLRDEDPAGMHQFSDLCSQKQVAELKPENLHATAGGAGATADKHHQKEQRDAEGTPSEVVGRGITGGGNDRHEIEGGVGQRLERLVLMLVDEHAGEQHAYHADDENQADRLLV